MSPIPAKVVAFEQRDVQVPIFLSRLSTISYNAERFRPFKSAVAGGSRNRLWTAVLRQDKQGQSTVLVVDDDPGLQHLFRTFLKKIGFSRVVVGTAKDAIKSLEK
jgi:hypothetical protein